VNDFKTLPILQKKLSQWKWTQLWSNLLILKLISLSLCCTLIFLPNWRTFLVPWLLTFLSVQFIFRSSTWNGFLPIILFMIFIPRRSPRICSTLVVDLLQGHYIPSSFKYICLLTEILIRTVWNYFQRARNRHELNMYNISTFTNIKLMHFKCVE